MSSRREEMPRPRRRPGNNDANRPAPDDKESGKAWWVKAIVIPIVVTVVGGVLTAVLVPLFVRDKPDTKQQANNNTPGVVNEIKPQPQTQIQPQTQPQPAPPVNPQPIATQPIKQPSPPPPPVKIDNPIPWKELFTEGNVEVVIQQSGKEETFKASSGTSRAGIYDRVVVSWTGGQISFFVSAANHVDPSYGQGDVLTFKGQKYQLEGKIDYNVYPSQGVTLKFSSQGGSQPGGKITFRQP